MRFLTIAPYLVIGLALTCTWATSTDPTSPKHSHPDLLSPYQHYELELNRFCPAPNRSAGVLLHVRINGGHPLRLVLDSGAEFVVLAAKTARSAGLSGASEMELVGLGTTRAKVGRADNVGVGPISFRNCPVAIVQGKVIDGADGVIPLAIFSDFLIRLDLAAETLELAPYPDEHGTSRSNSRAGAETGFLVVGTLLNRRYRGYVLLDTGAYCSAISREVAGAPRRSLMLRDLPIGAGTGETTGQLVAGAARFEIAGQELVADDVVALDMLNLSRHCGVDVVGLLGFPALRPYVLTIDYRNRAVKIDPKPVSSSRER